LDSSYFDEDEDTGPEYKRAIFRYSLEGEILSNFLKYHSEHIVANNIDLINKVDKMNPYARAKKRYPVKTAFLASIY